MEDAEEKSVLHEEACAKVNSQKEELDDIERQVNAARVQVQLPDQGEESCVDGSEDEARREVEAGLGRDIDGSTRKRGRTRGRSRSPAPPVRASGRPSRLLNLLPRPRRNWTFSVLHSWQR